MAQRIILLFSILMFVISAFAQEMSIRITFELDGVPKSPPQYIEFWSESGTYLTKSIIKDGKFNLPTEITETFFIPVFKFEARQISFYGVSADCLKASEWKVGIDQPPFDLPSGHIRHNDPIRDIKEVWFIEFNTGIGASKFILN